MCINCYQKIQKKKEIHLYPQYEIEYKKGKDRKQRKPQIAFKISKDCLDNMVNQGFNTVQIANTCGMSRQGVHYRLDKTQYKIKTMWHKHYEAIFLYKIGFDIKEISNLSGISVENTKHILDKYNVKKRVHVPTKNIARDLYKKGVSVKKIATLLELSIAHIRNCVYGTNK